MTEIQDLSVAEALRAVLSSVDVLGGEPVPLLEALGRVLVEPVAAQDSLPPFANSSMDGYALRAADITGADPGQPVKLKVVGDIAAGYVPQVKVGAGQAARITTGAPLPPGADSVVPVEYTDEPWREAVRTLPEEIEVRRSVSEGAYVRWPGEDVSSGEVVLLPGEVIRPQEIGLLASLGVDRVTVVRRPRVGLLATGDELVAVDEPLSAGKIRNSNSYVQASQISLLGATPVLLGVAGDSLDDTRSKLNGGLRQAVDLFVTSAGVSVGAFDVVRQVLEEGGDVAFWRVRMRPGKPLAFGRYGSVPFLGLPGNPVSAMVSFERFARPAILKMAGHSNLGRPSVEVIVEDDLRSDGRETYARAIVRKEAGEYRAVLTGRQGSHMMTSLVKANALVVVPEGVESVAAGQRLEAMMIDWPPTVF
jgi:molybdopterin molybdotransferase